MPCREIASATMHRMPAHLPSPLRTAFPRGIAQAAAWPAIALVTALACLAAPASALAAQSSTPAASTAPADAPTDPPADPSAAAGVPVPDQAKGYAGADLPAAPTVSGDVITVTPANAQYALDGAYGSINGKTVRFSAGTYGDLVLGRPSKYVGSETTYHTMKWEGGAWVLDASTTDLAEHVAALSNVSAYERTLENVTFTADEGATIAGLVASSGYVYGIGTTMPGTWNCVLDVAVGPGQTNSYYGATSLKNVTFDGLTIWDGVSVSNYPEKLSATVEGLTFKNCRFTGDAQKMATNGYTAVNLKSDRAPFSGVVLEGNVITNYFQGLYVQGPDGLTVSHNVIDGTTHNAVAVQSTATNPVRGTTHISENIIKGARDRAIRVGDCDPGASITVENNAMVNSGDSAGENFKAGKLPAQGTVSLENNYWSGRQPGEAVANAELRPTKTGVSAGTFPEDVTAYVQADRLSVAIEPTGAGTGTQARYLVGSTAEDAVGAAAAGQRLTVLKASGALTVADGVTVVNKSGSTITVNGSELADGAEVTVHVHSFGTAWEYDAEHHWHACVAGDGARADEAAHVWGDWVATKEPTATEAGSRERACAVCGYVQVEEIAATGTGGDDGNGQPDDGQEAEKDTGAGEAPGDELPQTGDVAYAMPAALTVTGALAFAAGAAVRRGREA